MNLTHLTDGEAHVFCGSTPSFFMTTAASDVTALLAGLNDRDAAVLRQLLPAVYEELRRSAHNQLRDERDAPPPPNGARA
jgi:hypothetical protein